MSLRRKNAFSRIFAVFLDYPELEARPEVRDAFLGASFFLHMRTFGVREWSVCRGCLGSGICSTRGRWRE